MPQPPNLASLTRSQVAALVEQSNSRKKRLKTAESLGVVLKKREFENILIESQPLLLEGLTGKSRKLAQSFSSFFQAITDEMNSPFVVKAFPKNHLHLLHLDDVSLQDSLDYMSRNRDFSYLVQSEGERLFGPKAPVVAGHSGQLPDLQALLKYSVPLKEAAFFAAGFSDVYWQELLRREKLSLSLGWAKNSVGEFVIRHLDPRWTSLVPGSAQQSRVFLENLVWSVLGNGWAPSEIDINDRAEWAKKQSQFSSITSANSLPSLSESQRQEIVSAINNLSKEYDQAKNQTLANGLGLDLDLYLASAGTQKEYLSEPGSLMDIITQQIPELPPGKRLALAANLLDEAIKDGRIPAKFDHSFAFFTNCGLAINASRQVYLPLFTHSTTPPQRPAKSLSGL